MKKLIKRLLGGLGYSVNATRTIPRQLRDPRQLRPLRLDDLISRRMMEAGTELTFIQIGAFDGVTGDPLRPYVARYPWRGVLLEPQPAAAARLRKLYAENERIVVLERAVDSERRSRPFFTVDSDSVPAWAGGLASFERQHIVKHAHLVPGLENMIRETTVECVTFDDVLHHLPDAKIDILQIDAEGSDAFILSLFPFERIKPPIVHWEIKNLGKHQREECLERLSQFGYRFAPSGEEDMMAVLESPAL